ncbi:MAG: hypothetical protein KDC33_01255 [Thermoleophilia bacterium]|nr:hypothetical protein [Thermoleophilia bacterium]
MSAAARRLIAASTLAGIALVGLYLLLGGGRYTPLASADPCDPRPWRDPQSQRALAEQVALSSLDGAACELHVTREELTLALASEGDLERFRTSRGLSRDEFDDVLRSGLRRAVSDGEEAGAINGVEAFILRRAVDNLPVQRLIEAYRSGELDWLASVLG